MRKSTDSVVKDGASNSVQLSNQMKEENKIECRRLPEAGDSAEKERNQRPRIHTPVVL